MFRLDLGFDDALLRRHEPPQLPASWASPAWPAVGLPRTPAGPRSNRPSRGGHAQDTVGHPDLARRRAQPHGHVRHEARRPGGVPRHLAADPHATCRASTSPSCSRRQAQVADKFSIVRSLHHDTGDHFAGGHRMLTDQGHGRQRRQQRRSSSPASAPSSPARSARAGRGMPAYVGVPDAASIGLSPGYFGGHMLGAQHNPFQTGGDPNTPELRGAEPQPRRRPDARPPGRPPQRCSRTSTTLRRDLDASRHGSRRWTASTRKRSSSSPARRPARRSTSAAKTRGCATATAATPGARARCWPGGWSRPARRSSRSTSAAGTITGTCKARHGDATCRWSIAPCRPCSTTWTSAACWTTTLVVLCGEFSRTPRMNDGGNGGAAGSMGTPGRDHWGNAMFCLMGGGGVKGGQIVGSTDRLGDAPAHAAADAVQHPRHDLPGAGHRPAAATARPERPAGQRARRPDADRGVVLAPEGRKIIARRRALGPSENRSPGRGGRDCPDVCAGTFAPPGLLFGGHLVQGLRRWLLACASGARILPGDLFPLNFSPPAQPNWHDRRRTAVSKPLVLRCQGGDAAAFAELVERYAPPLRYFVRKMLDADPDDVLQDVWLDVFRGVGRLLDAGVSGVGLPRITHDRTCPGAAAPAARHRPARRP